MKPEWKRGENKFNPFSNNDVIHLTLYRQILLRDSLVSVQVPEINGFGGWTQATPWGTAASNSFLLSLFVCTFIAFIISPDGNASTMFHWFNGACMLGAFFILTDPVSSATSAKGRIVYGALAGLLVFLIRKFGGYPDAVAFSVLLCNMAAPLIDQYTRPRTYGHQGTDK